MAVSDQFGSVGSRLRRECRSVTVSYRSDQGVYATTLGEGDSMDERVACADDLLPRGVWTRLCVSTPISIYGDLVGRRIVADAPEQWRGLVYGRYEGKTVRA